MRGSFIFRLLLAFLLCGVALAQQGYNKLLIANPSAFDGKRVRISGYLHLEFEDSAIYLHKEDSDHKLRENAIWIILPADPTKEMAVRLNNNYVNCEAVFSAKEHGHLGAYSGELSDIHWLDISPSRGVEKK
jgi:hypothetical protein